jgi:hypothetical protein
VTRFQRQCWITCQASKQESEDCRLDTWWPFLVYSWMKNIIPRCELHNRVFRKKPLVSNPFKISSVVKNNIMCSKMIVFSMNFFLFLSLVIF